MNKLFAGSTNQIWIIGEKTTERKICIRKQQQQTKKRGGTNERALVQYR